MIVGRNKLKMKQLDEITLPETTDKRLRIELWQYAEPIAAEALWMVRHLSSCIIKVYEE